MRRVWEQPQELDCNSMQRALRAFLEKDTKGYIQLMTGLERARASSRAAEGEAGRAETSPPDEGEERVRALIEELLAETDRAMSRPGVNPTSEAPPA
jgi:hypothetical protein